MKKWLLPSLFFLSILVACNKARPVQEITTASSQPEKPKPAFIIDTVYSVDDIIREKDKQVSEVKVGSFVYKAVTEAYSLNDSSLFHTSLDTVDEAIHVYKNRTHQYVYKISLLKDGNLIYNKRYKRGDFYERYKDNLIMESVPLAPSLRGITQDGRAVFEISFAYPESDIGMLCFITTDLKGTLLQLEPYSSFDGCYSPVQTSPDRKYFLTCTTLYGPNGYEFEFAKPYMVHAQFLTDTSFVAVYDLIIKSGYRKENGVNEYFEEKDKTADNLIIYHVKGQKLAGYRYDGFAQEFGYSVPAAVVPEKDQLLLLDPEKKILQTISISKPKEAKVINLSSLEKLTSRLKGKHLEQELYVPGNTYFFYYFPSGIKYYVSQNNE